MQNFYFSIIVLSLLLSTVGACRNKSSRAPSEVQLTFVRSGLAVDGATAPVEIKCQGRRVPAEQIDLDEKRSFFRFEWTPSTRYDVFIGDTPRQLTAPVKPTPYQVRTIELERVDSAALTTAIPDSTVQFSPDEKYLAIGTLFGHLQVVEALQGKTLWKKKLAEGMVKQVAFSSDGETVYAGEQSPDGFLYALDRSSGEIRWKYRLADDLEASSPPAREDRYGIYFLPGVYQLHVTPDGRLLCAGTHSWNVDGEWKNRSRLYVFKPDGSLDWAFPEDGPMDANVISFASDRDGKRLVFVASRTATTPPTGPILATGVYALDLREKTRTWSHQFQPLEPYFRDVHVWEAVGMTPDGARVVVGLGDGRAALFEGNNPGPESKVIEMLELGTPIEVSGVPIVTPVGFACASQTALFLQTNDSNIPVGTEATSRTPPAPHPSARTLFAFDLEGRPLWRLKSEFTPAGLRISDDGRSLMMTMANARDEKRTDGNGFVLLDASAAATAMNRVIYQYPTEGPVFFHGAISGKTFLVAVTESPASMDDGQTLYGTYQVHLVH